MNAFTIRRGRIDTDKPLVFSRGGVDFTLPEDHTAHFHDDPIRVLLHAVGGGGGTYEVIGIEDEGEEVRILVCRRLFDGHRGRERAGCVLLSRPGSPLTTQAPP